LALAGLSHGTPVLNKATTPTARASFFIGFLLVLEKANDRAQLRS
jgi:hypothetical protein